MDANSHPRLVREAWVIALRSGRYKPCITTLRQCGNRYDALGVLCDIAQHSGIGKWILRGDEEWRYEVPDSDYTYNACLPPVVAEWAGLGSTTGELLVPLVTAYGSPVTSLCDMSDYPDFTFDDVADVICQERLLLNSFASRRDLFLAAGH